MDVKHLFQRIVKTWSHYSRLATKGTEDEEKQNKNTTQYVLDTNIRKQASINNVKILNVFDTNTNYTNTSSDDIANDIIQNTSLQYI
jgi:hypothetical protein